MAHEFHVPEVLSRLFSLPATVFSRSDCDWTGVSLIVTEILLFDFQGSLSENLTPHIYKESFQGIFEGDVNKILPKEAKYDMIVETY